MKRYPTVHVTKGLTSVNVLRGCLAGTPSTNMYAWGVTIAGLMKRKKKKPPMREQMA